MKFTSRRTTLTFIAAGAIFSTLIPSLSHAQGTAWPSKPVSLLVGYPPGGLTDAGTRFSSKGMAAALGQSVVVENKPGPEATLPQQRCFDRMTLTSCWLQTRVS